MTCFGKSQRTSHDMFGMECFGWLQQPSARNILFIFIGTLVQRHVDNFKNNSTLRPRNRAHSCLTQSAFKVRIRLDYKTPHDQLFFFQRGWTGKAVYRRCLNRFHLWHSVADKICLHIVPCPDDIWEDGKRETSQRSCQNNPQHLQTYLDRLRHAGISCIVKSCLDKTHKTHKVYIVL